MVQAGKDAIAAFGSPENLLQIFQSILCISKKSNSETYKARRKASESNAIMSLGNRLGSFSGEDMWDVFTSNKISAVPDDAWETVQFDNGKLMLYSLNGKPLREVSQINSAALMAICKAVFDTDMRDYGDGYFTLALYLPGIFEDLGIDPRSMFDSRTHKYKDKKRTTAVSNTGKPLTLSEQRVATMEKLLKPFDRCVAYATNGSYYRLCVIESYDAEKQLLYVSSPFFFKTREILASANEPHRQLTTLFHADVANERNLAAVELANCILSGVVRRGVSKSDNGNFGTFTWKSSFANLVDKCPQVRM